MKTLRRAGDRIIKFLGYQIVESGLPPAFSAEVAHTVETVQPFTMTSPERICSLIKAVEYIVTNNIPGDIVECGVWKGGSMMAVGHTLLRLNRKDRALFLFDTFEGMPPAAEVDRNFRGESAAGLLQSQDRATSWIWGSSPLEEVRTNLKLIHYPFELVNFVKGRYDT